ncbi:MAG: hypothetical protein ABIY37_03745 [Devosia sp.]
MPKTLPPFAASYLGRFPPALERFDLLAAMTESLSAAQRARYASQTSAADNVQELNAKLAQQTNEKPRDPAAEQRLANQIEQAKAIVQTAETATIAATRVSHGTRVALDKVSQMIEGTLAGENADLELAAPPKLPKGKPADIALAQRAALDDLDDQVETIERALAPKAEVLALAQGQIAAESRRGALRVSARGSIIWPETPLSVLPLRGSEVVKIPDVVAMLAALHADALGAAVEEAVNRLYANVPADQTFSGPERKRRLAQIKAQRFEIELLEVEAVFQAWRDGDTSVGLRPDCDPLAVLGVRSTKAGEARQSLGLSIVEAGRAMFGA